MNKYHKPLFYLILACAALTSCLGGKSMATGGGGEVTGQRSSSFTEPTPYGMVQVKRGYLKTGLDSPDTLWGTVMPAKEISVETVSIRDLPFLLRDDMGDVWLYVSKEKRIPLPDGLMANGKGNPSEIRKWHSQIVRMNPELRTVSPEKLIKAFADFS